MICVSVSFSSKHNMSIPARRSAHPSCEEEGLKCNPPSSDVLIAPDEIGEGLGGWRACLSTPSGDIILAINTQQGSLDMHIESFVSCPTNDNFTFSTKVWVSRFRRAHLCRHCELAFQQWVPCQLYRSQFSRSRRQHTPNLCQWFADTEAKHRDEINVRECWRCFAGDA